MDQTYAFVMAELTGFVAAGLVASFYQLMTNKAPSFTLLSQPLPTVATGIVTLVFAGPAVIMRNAVRARLIEDRAWIWLALSTCIAVFWSFMSGIFVLSLIIAV